MSYADKNVTPLPGDFAVIPVAGPVGTLISIGEWLNGNGLGNFDHAEIYVGNGQTLGAYPGGAALKPVPVVQQGWLWSTGHIPLTNPQRDLVVSYALSCQGIPYGWDDYLFLLALRLGFIAPGSKAYVSGRPKYLICSQLVDWVYMRSGIHLFSDDRLPGAVTPANLAEVILAHGRGIVYD